MAIFDPQREKEIIDSCTQNISEDEKKYIEKFLRNLMDISKEVQSK
jgi:chorismate mutase